MMMELAPSNIRLMASLKNSFMIFLYRHRDSNPGYLDENKASWTGLDDSGTLDTIDQIMSLFNIMDSQKTIIFLHGWGMSSKIFRPFYHYFKNDFIVYFLDLPGFGDTPIERPMVLNDYAEFVYKFIQDNNIVDPIIVGHSFGGAVATKLAIIHPEILSKLILVDASAIRQPHHIIKLAKKLADLLKPLMPFGLRKWILKLLKLDKTDYAQIESDELRTTFKKVIHEDLSQYLPSIKSPTLVIWGENDTATPLSEGRLIANLIPNAKLSVIKHTGHFLFLEKPLEFVNEIKKFIVSPTA